MKAYTQTAFCKRLLLHFQFIHIFQDFLHMTICTLSLRSQLDTFCMADKKLSPHVILHGADHLAYIRLGGKKYLCSLAERTCFCTGCKILDLFYIQHISTPVFRKNQEHRGRIVKLIFFYINTFTDSQVKRKLLNSHASQSFQIPGRAKERADGKLAF